MKLPLGITFTLLLILQTFQQVSTQIPPDWQRDNMGMDGNETQSSSEKPSVQPPPSIGDNMEMAQANTEGSSDDEGEPSLPTSFTFTEGDKQKQNPTTLNQIPNDTEEASSAGPIAATTPPMVALNSSSDPSDASAESNETQTHETTTNTPTPEPEHTNQSALNDTYNSAKPETTTTESSLDKSSSAYLPSDDVPTNSTTSPATTTTDGSVQYNTTVSPTEPPANRTTTPVIPFAIPEDITTPAPASEDTGANPTGPFDNRGNSERGLSSDVTDGENKKGQAWAIVLAVGIVVGIIALAAFIILNRRNRRDFSHRKLVEETSPDPVLRLDNSEPLDLKFDGFGYYNPGLQGDNIQMTNFPQGRTQ